MPSKLQTTLRGTQLTEYEDVILAEDDRSRKIRNRAV